MSSFAEIANDFPEPYRLLLKENVESTNDEVRALGENGAPEGVIVLAENQSAGRGRRGAKWYGMPGESLMFSILVRPGTPRMFWPRLALAAGVAVAEALGKFTDRVAIKWPNDVWINGKKVAGILVETTPDFAVVGIGVNVSSRNFPGNLSQIATSVALASGRETARENVFGEIINAFAVRENQIGETFSEIIEQVYLRCALSGKFISARTPSGVKCGVVQAVGDDGGLIVQTAAGLETLLQADDIRIKPYEQDETIS